MKKLAYLSFVVLAFFIASCGSDSGLSITIDSPTNGDTFSVGDDFVISATVTDDVEVASIDFEAVGVFTGSVTNIAGPDLTTVTFSDSFPIDSSFVAGDYTMTITATDNEGNSESESVDFSIQ